MAFPMVFRRLYSTGQVSVPNPSRLAGRVAVVTASTAGIGLAIARRLGQEGAKVVVSSRKKVNVEETVNTLKQEGIEVHGIPCHVGLTEDRAKLINETVSKYGGLDILVSNAAANPHFGPIMTCNEELWDKIMSTNIKASFFLAKEAHTHLAKSKNNPSIVFVSSIAGYESLHGLGAYSISKTALLAFPQILGRELAPKIRVNGVAPGVIKTSFSKALWEDEKTLKKFSATTPLNRLGEPEQVASTVAFLCSDDASYISGETITVAGGMRSRL